MTTPSAEDARHLFEVRAGLEGMAVAMFTRRASSDALKRLHEYLSRSTEAVKIGDVETVLEAHNAFHEEIAKGCGNRLLTTLIANLRDRAALLRGHSLYHPGRPQRALAEHVAILRMIELRKAREAERLLKRHLTNAWKVSQEPL